MFVQMMLVVLDEVDERLPLLVRQGNVGGEVQQVKDELLCAREHPFGVALDKDRCGIWKMRGQRLNFEGHQRVFGHKPPTHSLGQSVKVPLNQAAVTRHDALFPCRRHVAVKAVHVAEHLGFRIEEPHVRRGQAPHQGQLIFFFAEQAGFVNDIQPLEQLGVGLSQKALNGRGRVAPQKAKQLLVGDRGCNQGLPQREGGEGHARIGHAVKEVGGPCPGKGNDEDGLLDGLLSEPRIKHPVEGEADLVPHGDQPKQGKHPHHHKHATPTPSAHASRLDGEQLGDQFKHAGTAKTRWQILQMCRS